MFLLNKVNGALAASAPVWQFDAACGAFSNVTTSTFRKADTDCPSLILSSWQAIDNVGKTKAGLKQLTSIFRLCETLTDVNDLKGWLNEIYVDVAMSNYPYASSFLSDLPGRFLALYTVLSLQSSTLVLYLIKLGLSK